MGSAKLLTDLIKNLFRDRVTCCHCAAEKEEVVGYTKQTTITHDKSRYTFTNSSHTHQANSQQSNQEIHLRSSFSYCHRAAQERRRNFPTYPQLNPIQCPKVFVMRREKFFQEFKPQSQLN